MNIKRIINDERGATMTEFVMLLPIWITMMIGIINLGQIGMVANSVELKAQQSLWEQMIPLTDNSDITHITPIGAGAAEQSHIGELAVDSNPHRIVDSVELGAHGFGLEVGGHWGESYYRTVVFSALADDLDDLTYDPADIIGDSGDRPYPHLLLNDSINREWDNIDGVGGIVASFISGGGFVASMLAGVRYGVVFSEADDGYPLIGGRTSSLRAEAHFDALVAPSPIRTKAGTDWGTFGGAFLLAQTIEQPYQVMQTFGKDEWDDSFREEGSADDRLPDVDGELEEALEDCREQHEEANDDCDDEEDGLEEGETLSQECQDLRANPDPCQTGS